MKLRVVAVAEDILNVLFIPLYFVSIQHSLYFRQYTYNVRCIYTEIVKWITKI